MSRKREMISKFYLNSVASPVDTVNNKLFSSSPSKNVVFHFLPGEHELHFHLVVLLFHASRFSVFRFYFFVFKSCQMELSELINKLFNGASVESTCIHEHDGRDKLLKAFARFAFRFLRFPTVFFSLKPKTNIERSFAVCWWPTKCFRN